MPFPRPFNYICGFCCLLMVTACGEPDPDAYKTKDEIEREENGSILNALGGIGSFKIGGRNVGGNVNSNAGLAASKSGGRGLFGLGGQGPGVEVVNENIWRAAYDLTSVLPVAAANRARGVIETDWYAPPGTTSEQMRVIVFVGSGAVTPSAIKVNAFRRSAGANGATVQAPASAVVTEAFENAILVRARELENL